MCALYGGRDAARIGATRAELRSARARGARPQIQLYFFASERT